LLVHEDKLALVFALDNAGSNSAARIAMMLITTNSSISVKAAPILRMILVVPS
jgi:hypothetical protein